MNLLKDATLAVEPRLGVLYSGFLSREKTREFRVSVAIRESFSAKIYFQAIGYRISGCGALGYHKFAQFSQRKSIFKQFAKVFFREKTLLYGSSRVVKLRQTTQNHGKTIITEICSLVQA